MSLFYEMKEIIFCVQNVEMSGFISWCGELEAPLFAETGKLDSLQAKTLEALLSVIRLEHDIKIFWSLKIGAHGLSRKVKNHDRHHCIRAILFGKGFFLWSYVRVCLHILLFF